MLAPVADAGPSRWFHQLRDSVRALGPEDTQPLPRLNHEPPPVPADLIELLRALGIALLNSVESAATTTDVLEDVAAAYDADVLALVMPTGIVFRIGSTEVDLVAVPARSLRLDQIAEVNDLIAVLRRAAVPPAVGLRRLEKILTSPPRFGTWTTLLGVVILSLGFGLMLNPDARALPGYVGLGLLVGLMRLLADRWATLSVALPVLAAFIVTVLSVTVVGPLTGEDTLRLLTPPLVIFLPGAALTIATIELASDQIVSGASRLVWGVSQLLLLGFGVFAGLSLVGVGETAAPTPLGAWAPWVGVLLVGLGFLFFSSAPPGTLPFIWLALFGAYAAQTLGAFVLGAQLSGFVGGLAIVPLTELIARFPKAPPAAMTLLPAFLLLVPGSLGLRGISQLAAGLGGTEVVETLIALFAVALGVLVGSSVTHDVRVVSRTWRR